MPTCKDCLCYAACHFHIDEETSMTVNECAHEFKHKDQYVKLPCYIGQPVWLIRNIYKFVQYEDYTKEFKVVDYEVERGTVSMLQQKANKSWKVRITVGSSVLDYTLNDLDDKVFINWAEAEKECDKRRQELKNEK